MHKSLLFSPRLKHMSRTFLYYSFIGLGGILTSITASSDAQAYDTLFVNDPDGRQLFELHFFEQDEYYNPYEASTWNISKEYKQATVKAFEVWAEIISPNSKNQTPILINIGAFDDLNADALSYPNDSNPPGIVNTSFQDGLIHGIPNEFITQVRIGKLDFLVPDRLSSIPTLEQGVDYIAVLQHELAHALGISSLRAYFPGYCTTWDSHLKDRYGTWLKPDMPIVKYDENVTSYPDNVFVVGFATDSKVTFHNKTLARKPTSLERWEES